MIKPLHQGQSLTREELKEIANNLKITYHARTRIQERTKKNFTDNEIKSIILNPVCAYFNTNGMINIAHNRYDHFIIAINEKTKTYDVVTYKIHSNNGIDIFQKRKYALMGYEYISNK